MYLLPLSMQSTAAPCFEQVPLRAAELPAHWMKKGAFPSYRIAWHGWHAVEIDALSDSLVAVALQGIAVVRNVSRVSGTWPSTPVVLYRFDTPCEARSCGQPGEARAQRPWPLAVGAPGSLHVHQARAAVARGHLYLLDLLVSTKLVSSAWTTRTARKDAPLALYKWTRPVCMAEEGGVVGAPSSCAVQMDHVRNSFDADHGGVPILGGPRYGHEPRRWGLADQEAAYLVIRRGLPSYRARQPYLCRRRGFVLIWGT